LEGTNTKIKLLNRQAYGFRDYAFFKLKILAPHETRP
jgi:transposase